MTKTLLAQLLEVNDDDILTAKEAAELLGIQHGSVLKAAERGGLEGTLVGRTWFFTRAQVENYQTRGKALDDTDRQSNSLD